MYYEVLVPSGGGYDSKLQIEAGNWMQALQTGVQHAGHSISDMKGFYIDLGNEAWKVTDPHSRRSYRVRVIDKADARVSQVMKAISGAHRTVDPSESGGTARPATGPQENVGFRDSSGTFRTIAATEVEAPKSAADSGRVMMETVQRTAETQHSQPAPLATDSTTPEAEDLGGVSETALEDVFLEIPHIFEPEVEMADAIDFVLDLAKKYIPCDQGGLVFTSDDGSHLYFAAARGRGTKKMIQCKLSNEDGVFARTMRSAVAISLIDATQTDYYDPAFTDQTGVKLGSVLAAPVHHGQRTFGVLAMMNRQNRDSFTSLDSNIVQYIATQMGQYIQHQIDSTGLE